MAVADCLNAVLTRLLPTALCSYVTLGYVVMSHTVVDCYMVEDCNVCATYDPWNRWSRLHASLVVAHEQTLAGLVDD